MGTGHLDEVLAGDVAHWPNSEVERSTGRAKAALATQKKKVHLASSHGCGKDKARNQAMHMA
jgi:hypothetical protein